MTKHTRNVACDAQFDGGLPVRYQPCGTEMPRRPAAARRVQQPSAIIGKRLRMPRRFVSVFYTITHISNSHVHT